jgi:hypothetical protein
MELAQALTLLWRRKIWVALGIVVALGAAVASVKMLKKQVYSTAATQMVVDSAKSPLGNSGASLVPFVARASVYADLMTSPSALAAIGQASGIPGTEIAATGPSNTAATGPAPPSAAPIVTPYKLFLDQDPTLPTVDIYAQAPTTQQAIALANGAVTGFANYLASLESQTAISTNQRVEIRQLGKAVGGVVDPGSNKKIAAIIFVMVLLIWCAIILLVQRARRKASQPAQAPVTPMAVPLLDDEDLYSLPARDWPLHARSDLQIGSESGNGRGGSPVDHPLLDDRDAALAEFSDRIAALSEPSPAPDEG